ncbi:MAG TPA: hypothetical protein VH165_10700 [Kofleriaceae bacterium]|nr:hypothetical protein [Kofleriaceae bacterium]
MRIIAILVLGAGCGATVREAVRDGIDEAAKPENLKKVTSSAHDLAAALVTGALDGGTSASKLPPVLAPLVEDLVRATMRAAAIGLDTDLSPAVERAIRASLDTALDRLLGKSTRRSIEDTENAMISAAMTGLSRGIRDQIGPALADTLDKTLGPALQRAIQDHLGPAIAETLTHDLKPALVATTRETATAAGEGLFDGMSARARPVIDQIESQLRDDLGQAKQGAHTALEVVVIAVLAAIAGVLAVVALLRHRAAVAARDALHLVATQIKQASGSPDVQRLVDHISAAGQNTRGGDYLSRHLRGHPAIRVSTHAA